MDRRDYNNEEREVFNNDRGFQPRRRFNFSRSDYQNFNTGGNFSEPNKPVYPQPGYQQPYSQNPYPQQPPYSQPPINNAGGYESQQYQQVPPQQPYGAQPYQGQYYSQQGDEFDFDGRMAPQEMQQPKKRGFFSFKSKKQQMYTQGDLQNILIVTPKTLSEVQDIIDSLRNRQAIIVQFNKINEKYAQRILDFLNGAIYALGGCEQRIGDNMFLFTPGGVSIQGPTSLKDKY
ncbi:MAG: cell division protein SepF [Clostridia bacterium]|nr:cell division protein SepF [Clostridia bacterium]